MKTVTKPRVDTKTAVRSRESKERDECLYKQVIDASPDAILLTDTKGIIVYANVKAARLYGFATKEQMVRYDSKKFLDDGNIVKARINHENMIKSGQDGIYEFQIRTKDRRQFIGELKTTILKDRKGNPEYVLTLVRDVTGERQVEQRIIDAQNRYKSIFDSNPFAMWIYDLETLRFVEVNDASIQQYGYTRDDFMKMKVTDICLPEQKDVILDKIEGFKGPKNTGLFTGMWTHIRKDGSFIDVQITSYRLNLENKNLRLVISVDIGDKKKVEEQNIFQALLLDMVEQSIIATDVSGNITYWNKYAEKLYGWSSHEVVGKYIMDVLMRPEYRDMAKKGFEYIIATGQGDTREMSILKKDGTDALVLKTISPVFGEDKSIIGAVGISIDISERKQIENELRNTYQTLAALIESSPVAVIALDMRREVTMWNPAAERIFGWMFDEVVGKQDPTIPSEDWDGSEYVLAHLGETESITDLESTRVRKDGSMVNVSISSSQLLSENGEVTGTIFLMTDITARKNSELALQESEHRYRFLAEAIPQIVWTANPDGHIDYYNQRWFEYSGLDEEESYWGGSWRTALHPEDLPKTIKQWNKCVRTGGIFQIEARFKRESDNTYRWHLGKGIPLVDENGRVLKWFGTFTDIEDQKQAQQQVQQSLVEKEILLKEIHHRVKNNLQIISSLLSLQTRGLKDNSALELFKDSQNRVRSMALIHEKLYQSADLSEIDFGSYIRNLAMHLFRSYGVRAEKVKFHLDVSKVYLGLDHGVSCGLIIHELLSNALKYAFPDGKEGTVEVIMKKAENDTITLTIRDNGIGLPEGVDIWKLDSLGLQLVKTLIEQIGGEIRVNTTNGTCFEIVFTTSK